MLNVAIASHFHTHESLLWIFGKRGATRCLSSQQPNTTQRPNVQNVNFWQKQTTDQQAKHQHRWTPSSGLWEKRPLSSRVKWAWTEQATKQTGFWIVFMCMFSWRSCFDSAQAQLECNPMMVATTNPIYFWNEEVTRCVRHCTWSASGIRTVIGICNKDANYKLMVYRNQRHTQ